MQNVVLVRVCINKPRVFRLWSITCKTLEIQQNTQVVFCFSTSHVLTLLSLFRLPGILEYHGVNDTSFSSEGEYDFVGICSDKVSGVYCRTRYVKHSSEASFAGGDCCGARKGLAM